MNDSLRNGSSLAFLNETEFQILHTLIQNYDKINDAADDATWILTSAFIIFTMQSGFGLLEAGSVTAKNESNIMMKNAIDVVCGGLSYWIFGFAFSFGKLSDSEGETWYSPFMGLGNFATGSMADKRGHCHGELYSKYLFQLSFATTATTIVSGAVAERTKLKAYILFSFLNTLTYVFPAHWIWDDRGFLCTMGAADVAGCGPVHLVGGVSALVSTVMLKPRYRSRLDRLGIFDKGKSKENAASPTNMVLGLFLLWWGWLGFNCGSTFGISGNKWKHASRAAVVTINGSIGGGIWAILYSYKLTRLYQGKLDIPTFISGVLGGLVSITGICTLCKPYEGLIIGFIGGAIASYGSRLLRHLHVDDPVACVPVHGFCGMWGMLVVPLFGQGELNNDKGLYSGVFYGGSAKRFGVQLLAIVVIIAWSMITTIVQFLIIDKTIGMRMSTEEELLGADQTEHGIKQNFSISCPPCNERSTSVLSLAYGRRHTLNGQPKEDKQNQVEGYVCGESAADFSDEDEASTITTGYSSEPDLSVMEDGKRKRWRKKRFKCTNQVSPVQITGAKDDSIYFIRPSTR